MPPRSYSSDDRTEADDQETVSTEGVTFTLDDVVFECHGVLDAQDMVDLAVPMADAAEGWFDPEALAAVGRFYRQVLGEETYRQFSGHRRRRRTPQSVVATIMMDLIEEITARPPASPSPSPGGPPPMPASSPAASPSPEPRVMRSPAWGGAVDPGGVIPPEMAEAVDLVLAPPATGAAQHPDPMADTHRTINLGNPARTRVEPADAN